MSGWEINVKMVNFNFFAGVGAHWGLLVKKGCEKLSTFHPLALAAIRKSVP